MKDRLSIGLIIFLPILFFILLVGFVYLPRTWANPQYNYLYSKQDGCQYVRVIDESLNVAKNNNAYNCNNDSINEIQPVYYHDVDENSTRIISIEEANKLEIDFNSKSPDGFELKRNSRNSGIFGGYNGKSWSLNGKGASLPQDLDTEEYYYGDIEFLGWHIEPI